VTRRKVPVNLCERSVMEYLLSPEGAIVRSKTR
jgi:hypothetical protein